jgi:hypothetical protein
MQPNPTGQSVSNNSDNQVYGHHHATYAKHLISDNESICPPLPAH